jgi:hypothetical protein
MANLFGIVNDPILIWSLIYYIVVDGWRRLAHACFLLVLELVGCDTIL